MRCKKFARCKLFSSQPFPTLHVFTATQPCKSDRCLPKNSQNTHFATFNFGCKKFARRKLFSSQPFSTLHVFYGVPTTQKRPLAGQKQSNHTSCHVYIGLQKVRAAQTSFIPAISHVTLLLRRPNHLKMSVTWPKKVKTDNLPRLVWAAESSRGANFFHPSHIPRYTSLTASQPRKNGRCLARNSQNTQFAPVNLRCKKFARCKLFSSQPFPTLHVFTATQPCKSDRCLPKNSQNTHFAAFNFGCKKFARRKFFSSQPFSTLHVFYGVPTTQKRPLAGQKQSNHTSCHVYIGLQKVRAAQTSFIPAISHVTLLLRRPNHLKMSVTWPKKVKTDNLPRLVWAAESSRGANFFHPSHIPRYTSFTASQLRKNDRWLAKNSQNSQFATFNLGCKKFARREFFSSPATSHVTRFYGVPTMQN